MKPHERSAAIAKALASEPDGLPKNFATYVAALAEANEGLHLSWNDGALLGAFVAMMGACVAGWFWLDSPEPVSADWLDPLVDAVMSQPWLLIGVAGVVIVQMLTFWRRVTT
jgi:alpha-beta hydrolase superfamily lysophospholipase